MIRVHVRFMIPQDLPELEAMEDAIAEDVAPLTRDDIVKINKDGCHDLFAAVAMGKLVGYLVVRKRKRRYTVERIVVAPHLRRDGIGSQLIERIKHGLNEHTRTAIDISVPERSLEVQLFLRSQRFAAVEVLKGCGDNGDDMFYFRYNLLEPATVKGCTEF